MFERKKKWAAGAAMVTIAAAAGIWRIGSKSEPLMLPERSVAPTLLPTVSSSPFLNTSADAKYVGSDQCMNCHADAHETYLQTTHSRALGRIQVEKEPTEASFNHEKSGRKYRVYRKNGRVHHQETLIATEDGDEVILCDFQVDYTIGSGNNTRSYLVEIDGFLMESPITWYSSKKMWALSPGYDVANHQSFSRLVDFRCLKCHAGRVEPVARNSSRVRFHEQQIGCENCHGPGSLHVAFHLEQEEYAAEIDYTIVNPDHLSRELNESICAQCHLSGGGIAFVRGRQAEDFRPGLPLTDFRIDYRLDLPETAMTVTGHFEQLHASKCYEQSATMTCTTCHSPHEKLEEGTEVEYYRAKCLDCHADQGGCGLPESQRLAQSPQNDCTSCHMKNTGIQIPHLVFTHHRIGLQHSTKYEPPKSDGAPLVSVFPLSSHLAPLERDRCLAIAYFAYSDASDGEDVGLFRQRALELFEKVHAAGIRDAKVSESLAWLYRERETAGFTRLARDALRTENGMPETRGNALYLLAEVHLQQNEIAEARKILEELIRLRLDPIDWGLLAYCRGQSGDYRGAYEAYSKSITIQPQLPDIHVSLANYYALSGKPQLAEKHRNLALRFEKILNPPP